MSRAMSLMTLMTPPPHTSAHVLDTTGAKKRPNKKTGSRGKHHTLSLEPQKTREKQGV